MTGSNIISANCRAAASSMGCGDANTRSRSEWPMTDGSLSAAASSRLGSFLVFMVSCGCRRENGGTECKGCAIVYDTGVHCCSFAKTVPALQWVSYGKKGRTEKGCGGRPQKIKALHRSLQRHAKAGRGRYRGDYRQKVQNQIHQQRSGATICHARTGRRPGNIQGGITGFGKIETDAAQIRDIGSSSDVFSIAHPELEQRNCPFVPVVFSAEPHPRRANHGNTLPCNDFKPRVRQTTQNM